MRVLVSWIRDFVDVTACPEEIAGTLGLRGFEVASIELLRGGDAVIDFEVTANRPDCLSVMGFARELAAVYDLPLRTPSASSERLRLADVPIGESSVLAVSIAAPELGPRYAAAVADLTPATTPAWMTDRLNAAGVRPISPIVDITNYVLMELGHPMHAFDLDALEGAEIRVRRAADGERLMTLDGVERHLEPEMLVIADARRAQAVAGVMGGLNSEVSARTRRVAFESAYFKPASVRRTSKRLGLKTEASARFERGADVNAPVIALRRAIALMDQLGAGRLDGSLVDRYPVRREGGTLTLRRDRLALLLGMSVPDADVVRILERLGLSVKATADAWQVGVPTFRVDLLREVDLIEEVGRHFGFERLAPTFPPVVAPAPAPDPRLLREQTLRRAVAAAGLSEAVTFGFLEAAAARAFAPAEETVALANPLSAKFDTLRPSLVPGLVDAVAYNRRHGRRDVALYEIGARFSAAAGEERALALAWTGAATPVHWSGAAREVDFFDAKGIVERVCDSLGAVVRFEPASLPFLVTGQAARAMVGDVAVGILGQLAPAVADGRGAPKADRILVAELNLDRLPAGRTSDDRVLPPPRFPQVVRDLSIVVSDVLPAEIIRGTIQSAAAASPLASIAFFDRYVGKGIAGGSVSLSVRLTFQASDRTLTESEVQQSVETIVAALVREHGASQR
jgi:phenylalanyl-tRNA synthetase beta chain